MVLVYYLTVNLSTVFILTKAYLEFRLPWSYFLSFGIFFLALIVVEGIWKTRKKLENTLLYKFELLIIKVFFLFYLADAMIDQITGT